MIRLKCLLGANTHTCMKKEPVARRQVIFTYRERNSDVQKRLSGVKGTTCSSLQSRSSWPDQQSTLLAQVPCILGFRAGLQTSPFPLTANIPPKGRSVARSLDPTIVAVLVSSTYFPTPTEHFFLKAEASYGSRLCPRPYVMVSATISGWADKSAKALQSLLRL